MESLDDQWILCREVELDRCKVCLFSDWVVGAWSFRNFSSASEPVVDIKKSSRTPAPCVDGLPLQKNGFRFQVMVSTRCVTK